MSRKYEWQWPSVGPTPVSYGLDSEIFDTARFPHVQTFVREAIQNTLDARDENGAPVKVRFHFRKTRLGQRKNLLSNLQPKKSMSKLAWPAEWDENEISWLVVEDSNSTGLRGDLEERTSDFWNY